MLSCVSFIFEGVCVMANSLTSTQLTEYLKNIKDLEVSCYLQAQVLQRLKQQPQRIQQEIDALEQSQSETIEKPNSLIVNLIIGVFVSAFYSLGGAVVGLIGSGIIWFVLRVFGGSQKFLFFIKCGTIIGFVLTFLFFIWSIITGTKDEQKKYPGKLKALQKKQSMDKVLIEKKKKQRLDFGKILLESDMKYTETQRLLQQYYNLGYIYPSYRGMVPICTIYQYFESGRCSCLEGHEGAYNLYENELRMNLILSKLDDIIYRLDDISRNQMVLAQEIKRIDSKISEISKSLDSIEANTTVSRYLNGITAANTSYLAWVDYIRH